MMGSDRVSLLLEASRRAAWAIPLVMGLWAGSANAYTVEPLPSDAQASITSAGAPFRQLGIRGNSVQNTLGLYGGHRASIAPGLRGFVQDRFALSDSYGEAAGMGRKALKRLLKAEGLDRPRGIYFQNGFYDLTATQGDDLVRLRIDALSGEIIRRERMD